MQRGDYVLQSGQEDPSTGIQELGHTLALNIKKPVFDLSRFHLYDVMFDGVRAQGGLTGYAHIAWAPEWYRQNPSTPHATWDSTLNVIQGKVDFFEVLQFRMLGLDDYYDFLSMGIKVTASAGSDMPWASTLGESRRLRPDRASVHRGRLVQGPQAGTHVRHQRADAVADRQRRGSGRGRERARQRHDPRSRARVGAAVDRFAEDARGRLAGRRDSFRDVVRSGRRGPASSSSTCPARESQWIAARVTTRNEGVAHTSPVYVLVDGQKFWDRNRLPELVKKRLAILDFGQGRLKDADTRPRSPRARSTRSASESKRRGSATKSCWRRDRAPAVSPDSRPRPGAAEAPAYIGFLSPVSGPMASGTRRTHAG